MTLLSAGATAAMIVFALCSVTPVSTRKFLVSFAAVRVFAFSVLTNAAKTARGMVIVYALLPSGSTFLPSVALTTSSFSDHFLAALLHHVFLIMEKPLINVELIEGDGI